MRKALAIFLGSLALCAAFMSWSSFADPDALYHAKASLMLWQHGPIRSFPWLDLTTLGTQYMDQHFLFHVIEAPFVAWLGMNLGARIVAILLAAWCVTACFLTLRWFKVRYEWMWVGLFLATSAVMTRLLLAKASPLAVSLFVLGLAATWKRKPALVFVLACIFALTHGGWVYLWGSIGFMMVGDALYTYVMEKKFSFQFVKPLIAAVLGVGLGLCLHPNFPADFSLLWVQIVKIGLATPFQHVILGSEWLPAAPVWVFAGLALWFIALGAGIGALFIARRDPFDHEAARATIVFAFPVAAILALTLKSRRSVEYLVPAMLLWIPWLWHMVDLEKLKRFFIESLPPKMKPAAFRLLVIVLGALILKNLVNTYTVLHDGVYPDGVYADAFGAISSRAAVGDRVFHSDWDEFPFLWSMDDRLKYVAGLDPTFLYEASSTLSDAYRDVTWGRATTTPAMVWDVVHDRLGARFVFIDKRDHKKLYEAVKDDARYELLRDTPAAATFEVKL